MYPDMDKFWIVKPMSFPTGMRWEGSAYSDPIDLMFSIGLSKTAKKVE